MVPTPSSPSGQIKRSNDGSAAPKGVQGVEGKGKWLACVIWCYDNLAHITSTRAALC